MWLPKSNADLFCSVPVADEDDEDNVEPIQLEPPTTEDEDAMDEQPLPGPSSSKRMKI